MVVARHQGVSAPPGRNPFGHIDLRVPSIARALPFYEALLPALGFTRRYDGGDWRVFATETPPPAAAYFGITESAQFSPNENRIAFWAPDRETVDRLAGIVAEAGAGAVSGPKDMPYGPGYYAVYFTDPGGNRFEVYHRPPL
jgi:catechol 2,3-dioxygenase-like lactoylglutathione lyase family enzyme